MFYMEKDAKYNRKSGSERWVKMQHKEKTIYL